MSHLRRLLPPLVGLVASLALGAFAWKAHARNTPAPEPLTAPRGRPVVVELFSSEGCSSCPSAETFLRELEEKQPIIGVTVLALEFHVDYWDYLGWKDPYSNHAFADRQETYARALRDRGIYTPEIIVQGRFALANREGDSVGARFRTEAARLSAEVNVTIEPERWVRVRVDKAPRATAGDVREVWLAVTEGGLHSEVLAGENRGRDLAHAAVVRRLVKLGEVNGDAFQGRANVAPELSWKPANLRFVGFVQEQRSRLILGAGIAG